MTDLQDQLMVLLANLPASVDPPFTLEELKTEPIELQEELIRRAQVVMTFFENLLTQNYEGDEETIVVHKISDYGIPVMELTKRNLETLLEKLDDPNSARTLIDPGNKIAVKAVPDSEHYVARPPGPTLTKGVVK